MGKYILKRFVQIVITLLVFQTLLFLILDAQPGDITLQYLNNPDIPPEVREQVRARLGLDKPPLERYLQWLKNFATGNLGVSYQYAGRPVWALTVTDTSVSDDDKKKLIFFKPHAHEPAPIAAQMNVINQLLTGETLDGVPAEFDNRRVLRQCLLGRLTCAGNDAPEQACRPFDADRSGTVIGEGGGLLLLEELTRAEARGARVYAEVVGFAAACDPEGVDYTRPRAGGVARAVAGALADAGIGPEEVDLVIPQGSGVPAEDLAEAEALRSALGERASEVPVVPLCGGFGSLFAGAGGVALAAAAMALHRQTVPPAVNCDRPDPACGLNVSQEPRSGELRHALCSCFSVGGQSAAVVLRRYAA